MNRSVAISCFAAVAWLSALACQGQELHINADEKKQLDPFEAQQLRKADAAFTNRLYRQAAADYASFTLEFPQSRVMPYVLFRHARSIQLDNKRNEAIKKYNEVLDYFPDKVRYAGAALYYIGDCYWQNGDPDNAVKFWTEMVQDQDYRKHSLAASALNMLAQNYTKLKNPEKAMFFYEQVATDFRMSNPEAALDAIGKVVEFRMKIQPDEPKLREFYRKARGFERKPDKIDADLEKSKDYWECVRKNVGRFGGEFAAAQTGGRAKFYRYWVGVMSDRFPEWDNYQISLANFQNAYENDSEKRAKRLDDQFEKYQKPGDNARVIRWLNLFKGDKARINLYYSKLDLDKLGRADKENLLFALLAAGEYGMARNLVEKMAGKDTDDKYKAALSEKMWEFVCKDFPPDILIRISEGFNDPDYGRITLLRFYHKTRSSGPGIPLAEKLASVPQYATEVTLDLGDLLFAAGQYEKAIAQYNLANKPPDTAYRIKDCYLKMKKPAEAIRTLKEIENFFPRESSKAALMIAEIYIKEGDQGSAKTALEHVDKAYPGTGECSTAHQLLEAKGFKTYGGIGSDDKPAP